MYLDTYLDEDNLTKDNDQTLACFLVFYANPPYPIGYLMSYSEKEVDVAFTIGQPDSRPRIDVCTMAAYAYDESVPIIVYTIDRANLITGEKMLWKAEAELRRIVETYPEGSLRTLAFRRKGTETLGGVTLYSLEFRLMYSRDVTT